MQSDISASGLTLSTGTAVSSSADSVVNPITPSFNVSIFYGKILQDTLASKHRSENEDNLLFPKFLLS